MLLHTSPEVETQDHFEGMTKLNNTNIKTSENERVAHMVDWNSKLNLETNSPAQTKIQRWS